MERYRIVQVGVSEFVVERFDINHHNDPPCFAWQDLNQYGCTRRGNGGFSHASRYASFEDAKAAMDSFRYPFKSIVVYEDRLSPEDPVAGEERRIIGVRFS